MAADLLGVHGDIFGRERHEELLAGTWRWRCMGW
jgi:hypothetical protein